MAIKRVIKFTKNVARYAKRISTHGEGEIFKHYTDSAAKEVRQRLVDGLDGGYGIKGGQFAWLKESTKEIRKKRGIDPNNPPLVATGKLRDSIKVVSDGRSIRLVEDGAYKEYGKYHNQSGGFVTGGMIPGKSVKRRNYWGIPKTFKEGGAAYKRLMSRIASDLRFNFKTMISTGNPNATYKVRKKG